MASALRVNPKYAEGHCDYANVLLTLNRPQDALSSLEKALAIQPHFPLALYFRGNALLMLRRFQDAQASLSAALILQPGWVPALSNRGIALLELKRLDEAVADFDAALAIDQRFVPALSNRGAALLELNRNPEALKNFDAALALWPQNIQALINRGNALAGMNRAPEALASFDRALAIHPDFPGALDGRAKTLRNLNRAEEAAETFTCLMRVTPDYPGVAGNLFTAQLHCCDWSSFEATSARLVDDVRQGRQPQMPLSFLLHAGSAQDQMLCAKAYVAEKYPRLPAPLWEGDIYKHDKIRIAYLSSDFRDHVVAHVSANLFEEHDRSRFEVTAISFGPDDGSPTRQRLLKAFDRFIDVSAKSDREAAIMLREMEIDIAVDLNGYTAGERAGIFTHRPAPIQVGYLGYPGTIGGSFLDYILVDDVVAPPGDDALFTEKLVRLPDTFFVTDSKMPTIQPARDKSKYGLPSDGFVFACFNGASKITPPVFDVWMRLLGKVPGSVLWLRGGSPVVIRNLRKEAAKRGVESARLIFASNVDLEDHLARHGLADIFLDTLPYNAHGTGVHALWAGLPIVTCRGGSFAGRVAASLLHALDLPELVTSSLQDYENRALRLATTPALLAGIKAKLATHRASAPLFNIDRFRRHIEGAYTAMWERYQLGKGPVAFKVPRLPT
jgi:protein O-GlcNAc transferase